MCIPMATGMIRGRSRRGRRTRPCADDRWHELTEETVMFDAVIAGGTYGVFEENSRPAAGEPDIPAAKGR